MQSIPQRTSKQAYFLRSVASLTEEIDRLELKLMELERQAKQFPESESLKREIRRYQTRIRPLADDRAKYLPFI